LPVDPAAAATLGLTDLQAAAEGRMVQRSFRSCVKASSRVFHADAEGSTERKPVLIDQTVRVKKRRFRGKKK